MNKTVTIRRAGTNPLLNVLGVGVQILIDETDTDGRGVVALCVCGPGNGAPPHRHDQVESFFVVEGCMSFFDGERWLAASAGDTVSVPAGQAHAFRNDSSEMAKFLTISMPAGHARFFREADEMEQRGALDPESIIGLCSRNGIALSQP